MVTPRSGGRRVEWDEARAQYVYVSSGRPIPSSAVTQSLEQAISASESIMEQATQRMLAGQISISEWQLLMEAEIKSAHIAVAALARGGWEQMTASDWGWVGGRLRTQYKYLRGFARELAGRNPPSNALFRSRMYAGAARTTYQEMRRRYYRVYKGAKFEMRVLDPVADHCVGGKRRGCVELAELGIQPVGTLPAIGAAQCLTHCKCHFVYFDDNMEKIG